MAFGVEIPVVFVGGTLALLSPCSALLVPAFFAYAFPSRGQSLLRRAIFLAGLAVVLVPVGLGVGALGSLIVERRTEVTFIAGSLLIVMDLYQLAIGGFEVPGTAGLMGRVSGDSAIATFSLGAVYGIAGFCAGPILGGLLTIAATTGGAVAGGAVAGGALLFVYALGMTMPLFLLSLLLERVCPWARSRVSASEWCIGRWSRPEATVISSLMFIALHMLFIDFQGSNALTGVYESFGASDLSAELETAMGGANRDNGDLAGGAQVVGAVVVLASRRWRQRRSGGAAADTADEQLGLDAP